MHLVLKLLVSNEQETSLKALDEYNFYKKKTNISHFIIIIFLIFTIITNLIANLYDNDEK